MKKYSTPAFGFLSFIIFLLAGSILFFSSETKADRLDELSSYCVRRWANDPCAPRIKKRKIRKRGNVRRAVIAPAPVAGVILERSPLACFRQLIQGKKFALDPLPPCFTIFANDEGKMSLQPAPDLEERQIPVVNIFLRSPGCYVACYSRNPDKAVYPVTAGIYLIGYVRVRGSYNSTFCVPENFEEEDIRGEKAFMEICSKSFSCIGNSCWAGPNTGAIFGLQ